MARPATTKPKWWSPGWSWKVWVVVALMLIPTFGFALWVVYEAGGQTKIDPFTLSVATANAEGPVIAITGTEHTVYHASAPLPEPKAPREDGKLTLVWFTSTACAACESQAFVHEVMADYRDNVVFVEKAVDRDSDDERLGVKGPPAFVWLDPTGAELGRFSELADPQTLRNNVEARIGREGPATP